MFGGLKWHGELAGCLHNGDVDFYRSDQFMICYICGINYRKHPMCEKMLASESMGGEPFLYVLCNGDHIKL